MLDENKKLYEQCAETNLPGWRDKSKSELCNIYLTSTKKYEKDGAVAAIIYKCWNIFNHNFRNQPYIPIEDWYESMIDAIMYVLKNHVWTDPQNILYGKPNGPEMALHRCIWSRKLNVYQSNKKPKRVINLNIYSIEDLKERAGVDPGCEMTDDNYIFVEYIKILIQKEKLEYCILLDLICSGVVVEKLAKEIRSLNNTYIDYFSKKYDIEKSLVEKIINQLQNNKQLNSYIDYYITCLQRDDDTLDYLK